MYSGTTLRTKSGRIMGVHQKVDRMARKYIQAKLEDDFYFPTIKEILHFEGHNGPDGLKKKSLSKEEPWHFIDPDNKKDRELLDMISDHEHNLALALVKKDTHRASFEAAWLAHAVVDGLTPAHHYPLEEKIEKLQGKPDTEDRLSVINRIILSGNSKRDKFKNNWEYWGAKGLMTSHLAFESGIATSVSTLRFDKYVPTDKEYEEIKNKGLEVVYLKYVKNISNMNLYHRFIRGGWTRGLARDVKSKLMPDIMKMVALSWYSAICNMDKVK